MRTDHFLLHSCRKWLWLAAGIGLTIIDSPAAEKKTYAKPPFAAFGSQTNDGLLGGDKYEKPAWNLHDALDLPNWLSVSLEQRTRYEVMDGSFKANG